MARPPVYTIQHWFAKHGSPVAPYSKLIYNYARKKGVNPFQVAAQIMAETEGGKTGTGRPGQYTLTGWGGQGSMRSYGGYPGSIKDTINNLASPRYKGKSLHNQTAMWVAGSSPNAKTDVYTHTIAGFMKSLGVNPNQQFAAGSPAQAAHQSNQRVRQQGQQQFSSGLGDLGMLSGLVGSISGVPGLGQALSLLGGGAGGQQRPMKPTKGGGPKIPHTMDGTPDNIMRLFQATSQISKKSAGYSKATVRGPLSTVNIKQALDCSLSVARALQMAHLGFGPNQSAPVSGWMKNNWGKPGKGKFLTMYASDEHVFLEFKIHGKFYRFDTSPHADPNQRSGPRLRRTQRSTAGFTARHWPGL